MEPKPLVDRRAVLRGAAALAGSLAAGAALTSSARGTGPSQSSVAVAQSPAGSGGGLGAGAREQAQQSVMSDEVLQSRNSEHETGDVATPSEPAPGPEPTGAHEAEPDPDVGDDANAGEPDSPGAEHHEPDPGESTGTGQGQGGGDAGQDPGGPPPLVDVSAVPVGGGVVLAAARVVVTQPVAGTLRCFGSRCTHRGCTVDAVNEGTIHCPCHGSLFDMDTGEPVAGPALSALSPVSITVKSGGVYLG